MKQAALIQDVDSRSGYGSEDRLHDIKDTRVIR